MAALRPVEERNARGHTLRVNPSITFKQDHEIRRIKGRHDWDLLPNPAYHPPITAQVQNGKIVFFLGTPDNSRTIALAKEISQADVAEMAPYIIDELTRNPIRVREQHPAVYEVRVTTIGDTMGTETVEIPTNGAPTLTVEPVAPNLDPASLAPKSAPRGGRVAPTVESAPPLP